MDVFVCLAVVVPAAMACDLDLYMNIDLRGICFGCFF